MRSFAHRPVSRVQVQGRRPQTRACFSRVDVQHLGNQLDQSLHVTGLDPEDALRLATDEVVLTCLGDWIAARADVMQGALDLLHVDLASLPPPLPGRSRGDYWPEGALAVLRRFPTLPQALVPLLLE